MVIFIGFILGKTPFGSFIKLSGDFLFTPKEKIEALNGRTNLLILGKGGEGHEAPDLTDTIILVSVTHPAPQRLSGAKEDPSITLISLPRDIWISQLKSKLNSVYYWGNQKQPGGGLILAKSTVEEISGQKIQYGVVIDFSAFKEVIDSLGGVEVEVERSFSDERYPIYGKENDDCGEDPEFTCRYETIHFEQGKMLMDGETALKFARSRNAEGDEGTDFARDARQQKILAAISNKVISPKILMKPKTISKLWEITKDSLETDISDSAAAILARRLLGAKQNLSSFVLPEEFLVNPPQSPKYNNLYVFIPKSGDWGNINKWFSCKITGANCN
jgi:LCP family protein required for cell wall assembly